MSVTVNGWKNDGGRMMGGRCFVVSVSVSVSVSLILSSFPKLSRWFSAL